MLKSKFYKYIYVYYLLLFFLLLLIMNDKVLLFIIEMALIKLEEEYDKAKIDILQFNGIIFQR